jgi:hypothetical protein
MPAVKSKTIIKLAVAFELTAKPPAKNDHIPQTTFGIITKAISVAKVSKIDSLYNATLMTTSLFVMCRVTIQLNYCIICLEMFHPFCGIKTSGNKVEDCYKGYRQRKTFSDFHDNSKKHRIR